MNQTITLLEDPATRIAVVGATDTPGKYGGKVYRNLKAKGYDVVPVNPGRDTVDGDAAFGSLDDLDAPPDLAVFVVPPRRTAAIISTSVDPALTAVWLQPGSETPDIVRDLEEGGHRYVTGACIMVLSRTHSSP